MKIIQLIQKPQRRGAEIFAAQLSQELQGRGHEVFLVSIFEGEADLPFSGKQIHLQRPLKNRLYDIAAWKTFAALVKEFQPDIIQANAADTLKFAVFSKMLFGWKNPIVYRNANQMGDFIQGTWHRRFNQFLVNRVAYVISVSEASKRDFLETFDFPEQRCQVVPIGIIPKEIDASATQTLTEKLPPSFLLQIGGLVPEKDPLGMLDIFKALKDPSIHLVFMGSGVLENELKAGIQKVQLEHRVTILPNQKNIFPILKQAKALTMPSKIEGLPAVVLEAMYLGIPVVAYEVGGIGEVVQNGKTGWLVPKGDKNAFVKAVQEVLTAEEDQLKQITEQARQLVLEQYTLEKVAGEIERVYFEVIRRK